ncbi:MAG: MDR family MFS transporter [Thermoleophilia bacterium]|jgi:EmrB/QacA subfamily drug resistance transporter
MALERSTLSSRDFGFVLVGLVIVTLLGALDQSILSTALPTIAGELNGVDQMLWVTTTFLLVATMVMPVYGKLGDLVGYKIPFMVGIVVFLLGSIIGGLAGDMTTLIVALAVLGLGGGGLIILPNAIIGDLVSPRQRGKYMGAVGSTYSVGSILGPLLGGWFADTIGWRWVFWINLPLGAVAFVIVLVFLKMPAEKRGRSRLDVAGITTMFVAVASFILLTSLAGRQYAWGSAVIIGLVVVTVVATVAFVLVEKRAAEPVMPLHLFRDRNFNLATGAAFLLSIAMFGVFNYLPSYLQMATGVTGTQAGLLMMPFTVACMTAVFLSGSLASKTGRYRWMPIASFSINAVALFLLSTLALSTPRWMVGLYVFILGFGIGLSVVILTLIVQNSFPVTQVGTATGAHTFLRELGSAFGSAIVGTIFTIRLMDLLNDRLANTVMGSTAIDPRSLTPQSVGTMPAEVRNAIVTSYNEALTPIFLYIVPVMILGGLLVFLIKEKPLAETNVTPVDVAQADDVP